MAWEAQSQMTEPSEARLVFTVAKAMAQSKLPPPVAPAVALSPAKPLRPKRLFHMFVMPIAIIGFTALPAAFGIEQPQLKTEAVPDGAPPLKQDEERLTETTSVPASFPQRPPESAEPSGPFARSFALDVAKTYVALSEAKRADMQRRQGYSQK
jgi:hypothetical protein